MQEGIVFFFLISLLANDLLHGNNPLAAATLAVALLAAIGLRRKRHQARIDFENQLKSHRRELRAGGMVVVDSLMLRYDSMLTTYRLSIGIILGNIVIPSKYYQASGEGHSESLVYSMLSLVSGWWAFPTGPVITLAVIKNNLLGGEQQTVGEIIDAHLLKELSYSEIPFQEHTKRSASHRQRDKKSEAEPPELPPSIARALERRTKEVRQVSTDERIQELNAPSPPGIKLKQLVHRRVKALQEDTKERILGTVQQHIKKQSKRD